MKRLIVGLLVLAGAYTVTYEVTKPKERYVDVIAESLPKVVMISCSVNTSTSTKNPEVHTIVGSGGFISKEGHILTVAHLFNIKAQYLSITVEKYDGWQFAGQLLLVDTKRDLAILKIEDKPKSWFRIARPDALRVGQEVIAIGCPLGLPLSATTGIISRLHSDEFYYDMVQMSAAINPGNSGGPLVNLRGELVGVNSQIVSASPFAVFSGLGFSVSASEINFVITDLRRLFKGL